jgi:DNA helicase-2/ATP-dependent DNA helicase PcrA
MAYRSSAKKGSYRGYKKPVAVEREQKPLPAPSPAQANILNFIQNSRENVVVLARAGTGKTTTIEMLVRKVNEVTPNVGILVCAFNTDIKDTIAARLSDLDKVQAQTSYSIGFQALKPLKVRIDPKEKIRPGVKVPNIIKGIIGPENTGMIEQLTECVQKCKVTLLDTEEGIENVIDTYDIDAGKGSDRKQFVQITLEVLKRNREQTKSIDFADMIYLPVVLGLDVPQHDCVMLDEGQDLAPAQFAVIMKSLREGGRMIAVGDDRQALYGWNGADAKSIQRIIEQTNAHVLPLSVTYRCARNIVKLLQEIVPDIEAAPGAPDGLVANMATDDMLKETRAGDYILARTNAPLMRICTKLNSVGRPANILGRDVSWQYTYAISKSGALSVEGFRDWNREWCRERREQLVALDKKTEWVDDKEACVDALCEGLTQLDQVRERIRTMFQAGSFKDRVMLSTAHRAKGDERDRVFMLSKTFHKNKNPEEANVYYVAASRARHSLYLVQ